MKELNKKIALIGMSGAGKTFWSTKLEESDYKRISCDDLIAEAVLGDTKNSTELLGEWITYPWVPGYKEKEKEYIDLEESLMLSTLDANNAITTVIDTTGSVIYCSENILRKLKDQCTIVYLSLKEEKTNELSTSYADTPRAIVWNNIYQGSDSPNKEEIMEYHKKLLTSREQSYEQLADITIDSDTLWKLNDANDLINYINSTIND